MSSLAKEVDILRYLPPILQEVAEFQAIANVENPILSALYQEIEAALNDQFIETASERGIARYESMLRITPFANDTLETRRFRVASKWIARLPYTRRILVERLNATLGEGRYELDIDKDTKTVTVKIELSVKRQFDVVSEMLEEMLPQNMVLIVKLRYNQHLTLAQFTHEHLSSYTHAGLREEVVS